MLKRPMHLIYSRANLWLRLVRARRRDLPGPIVANLFLTSRCNGQCRYCYTDKSPAQGRELSTVQWKNLISDLYARGCRMFNLMGGEPLLRDDFARILEHVRSFPVVCDVNTNGFLLPGNTGLLKGATQVFTSLDGRQKAHDANRGRGAFQKALAGIRAARLAGIPVRINCTLTRNNAGEIEFLVDFAEKWDLYLYFTPLVRIHESLAANERDLALPDQKAREVFKAVKKTAQSSKRVMNSIASLDFFIHYPAPLDHIVSRRETGSRAAYYTEPCPYGRFQFFFSPQGDVFPCHNLWNDPEFSPKNVRLHGLDAAIARAGHLDCRYCWLPNLVEWNAVTRPSWIMKGLRMTLGQALDRQASL